MQQIRSRPSVRPSVCIGHLNFLQVWDPSHFALWRGERAGEESDAQAHDDGQRRRLTRS